MACNFPYQTKDYGPVPCGYCPDCLKARVNAWAFRLSWEDRRSTSCYFVTLTYRPESITYSLNGYMNLCTYHFQTFMKRLRKNSKDNLRYAACGEYGSHGQRPHYHIILFNLSPDKIGTLYSAWPHGNVDCQEAPTSNAFAYVAAYTMSANRRSKRKRLSSDPDDRQPQSIFVSKGLGDNYLAANTGYHVASGASYVTLEGGVRIKLPRYYKDKLDPLVAFWTVHEVDRNKYFEKLLKFHDGDFDKALKALNYARHEAVKNFKRLHVKNKML